MTDKTNPINRCHSSNMEREECLAFALPHLNMKGPMLGYPTVCKSQLCHVGQFTPRRERGVPRASKRKIGMENAGLWRLRGSGRQGSANPSNVDRGQPTASQSTASPRLDIVPAAESILRRLPTRLVTLCIQMARKPSSLQGPGGRMLPAGLAEAAGRPPCLVPPCPGASIIASRQPPGRPCHS